MSSAMKKFVLVLLVAVLVVKAHAKTVTTANDGADAKTGRQLADYDYDYEDCEDWTYTYKSGYAWSGASSLATYRTTSLNACANLCIEEDGAYTFTYNKIRKTCTLYEEESEDLSMRRSSGSYAGEIECDD
jgi:hypothetical protein